MTLPTTTARQQRQPAAIRAPRVCYIGDREALDFQPARRRLAVESARGLCSLHDFGDAAAAIEDWEQRPSQRLVPADVMILAQLRPGELNDAEVNELRRRAPLAAMVALCGAWCEGEARSGRPLPGISHVAWHQFPSRWVRHREAWQQGRPTEWTLPATWREEDRLLHSHPLDESKVRHEAAATIVLPNTGIREDEWLLALARAQRWRVVSSSQELGAAEPPTIGIWSTDQLDASRLTELTSFVNQLHRTPVIVLAGFPRPEDDLRVRDAGAAELLAKPLLVDDLVAEISWNLESRLQGVEKGV